MKLLIRVLLLAIVALYALAMESAIWKAYGAPPPGADMSLSDWFRSLTQPGTGVSCCSISDCHTLGISQWRVTPDGYGVRIDGDWVRVPWERVLTHKDTPTGAPVACFNEELKTIYCFVRGTES